MYICLEAVNEWTKQHQLIPTTEVTWNTALGYRNIWKIWDSSLCNILSKLQFLHCFIWMHLYPLFCHWKKTVLTSSSYLFVKFRLLKYIQQELASNNNLFGSHNCWHKTCSKNGLQHNDHCYNQSKEQITIYTAFCTKLTSPKL